MGRNLICVRRGCGNSPEFKTTLLFICLRDCRVEPGGGVLYETHTPQWRQSQMFLLQTSVHPRSPESSSPALLFRSRLQKSQQSFEPEILARQTGKSELLARARTGGTGAHLA
jgi:hypothetical protein